MDQPSINPRVDEAHKRINSSLRGPVSCPCCGLTDWRPALTFIRLFIAAEADSGAPEEDTLTGVRTLPITCRNCGFIRLHLIEED